MTGKIKNTHLIVISAPSGAGKTTLCRKILETFPSLILSVSSTTRPPRGVEKNGVDYFFLTKEEFERQIRQGRFVEWANVHHHLYGTSREFVEKAFRSNLSVLLDIDVQGADQLQKSFPEKCHRIFIAPPNLVELESRLRARGTDSEESIQKRLENAKKEIEAGQNFDHIIVNDSLEKAYLELKNLLEKDYHLQARTTVYPRFHETAVTGAFIKPSQRPSKKSVKPTKGPSSNG